MKFYLAGKIAANDWRHSIVKDLRLNSGASYHPHADILMLPEKWPVMRDAIFGKHDYTGPYFTSDDHGCYHGRNSHGNDNSGCMGDIYGPGGDTLGGHGPDHDEVRLQVIRLCLRAIIEADVVFVWVNSTTMYGTLFELGFATAYKKPIWWAQDTQSYDLDDMWFARRCAADVIHSDDPTSALRLLIDHNAPEIDGYVYLLQSGDHYKIGKSKNVDQRVTQISPRTPLPVKLIHTISSNDMSWAESELHRKYAQCRTNGEWFALSADAVAWITSQKHLKRK